MFLAQFLSGRFKNARKSSKSRKICTEMKLTRENRQDNLPRENSRKILFRDRIHVKFSREKTHENRRQQIYTKLQKNSTKIDTNCDIKRNCRKKYRLTVYNNGLREIDVKMLNSPQKNSQKFSQEKIHMKISQK